MASVSNEQKTGVLRISLHSVAQQFYEILFLSGIAIHRHSFLLQRDKIQNYIFLKFLQQQFHTGQCDFIFHKPKHYLPVQPVQVKSTAFHLQN